MIKVRFVTDSGFIKGFELSGHSGYAESGEDIICAAVSSAAYMTANTITDVLNINAQIQVDDGFMTMMLSSADFQKAQDILCGFRLHLTALSEQYKDNITVKFSEV